MRNTQTVIELDYNFNEEEINKINKFFNKKFNINKNEIEIYKAKDYANQSDFAGSILEDIAKASLTKDDYI